MSALDLLHFLGFPEIGALEVETARGIGYFSDCKKAISTARKEGEGLLRLHPFNPGDATNKTSPHTEAATPTHFGAVVARFHYEIDEDMVDTEVMAERLAETYTRVAVWFKEPYGYIVAAVEPFPIKGDLDENRQRWMRQLIAQIDWPGAEWELVDQIPFTSGRLVQHRPRTLNVEARRHIYREIPRRIWERINKSPNSKLSMAFRGSGKTLFDRKGEPIPPTPAAFDERFVRLLFKCPEDFSDAEIVDAVWNRPDGACKAKGLPATEEFVKQIIEEEKAQQSDRPRAPSRKLPEFTDDDTLRDHLHGLYYQPSEKAGWVHRADVEIHFKAEVVFRFLLDRGAAFYYFEGSNETVFVLDGQQINVNTGDQHYQNWFTTAVQLFTAEAAAGRELTSALRTLIQRWPHTHRAEAHWGRYDEGQQRLYLCFDPKHTQVIRVQGDPQQPDVQAITNGTDDVTLRGMAHRQRAVELMPNAIAAGGLDLFVEHVHNGQGLPCERHEAPNYRLVSTMFNLTAMLPLHRHRPLKFHQGARGSGKTSAAFDFQSVLYGSSTTGGADYREAVNLYNDISVGGPVTVQDNAESKDRRKFEQAYLVPASGKVTKIRKYYTEAGERAFMPNGSLTITAIEGLSRPEELRRTFEFNFDQKYHRYADRDDFSTRDKVLQDNADLMLSALLEVFSVHILPNFENRYRACRTWMDKACAGIYGSKRDYSDWLGRVLAVMEACGHLFVDDKCAADFDARAVFKDWMTAEANVDAESQVHSNTTMALFESLRNLAEVERDRLDTSKVTVGDVQMRYSQGDWTIGPFTAANIHNTFGMIASRYRLRRDEANSRATLARIKELDAQSVFRQEGWTLEKAGKDRTKNCARWVVTYSAPTQTDVDAAAPVAATVASRVLDS